MARKKEELLLECIEQFKHIEDILNVNTLSTTKSLIDEINEAIDLDYTNLSLIDNVKKIAFGSGSAQERMEEIKALFI